MASTVFDHAVQTANGWLADVGRALGTEDRQLTYRMLRAWLHALRDRLPADVTAHLAAQLPEVLRGVYYDGWDPSRTPVKYGPDEYQQRFADEALISVADVPAAAAAITGALAGHLSPGQLDTVFGLLPGGLRELIDPGPRAAPAAPARVGAQPAEPSTGQRLARLEDRVQALTDSLRTLAEGLQQAPAEEPAPDRAGKAARLAHEILLTAPDRSGT